MIPAAAAASLVTGLASFLFTLVGDPAGFQIGSFLSLLEVAVAAGLLSVLGGFLPAALFLWLVFHIARSMMGQTLRFVAAGGLAGVLWLAIAWPTRPGSAVWTGLIGLPDAPCNLARLLTGQILFAGVSGEGLTVALVAAPLLGGAVGGLVYGRLSRQCA